MGSASGKKHKKDKKNKHHSKSPHSLDDEESDMVADSNESEGRHRHHHKHKKHKSHKEKHKSRQRERDSKQEEVIQCDSDSSDCIEVPLEGAPEAPPPPKLSKNDYERQQRVKEYEVQKQKEIERQREREYEYTREKERDRERYEREKERERYEREKERERYERDKERERFERERYERERERERYERERETERRRERDRDRDRPDRHRSDHDRVKDRNADRSYGKDNVRERSRSASPIPENGAGDVLSVQETNKLRAKLGLKPLEVSSGPSKSNLESSTSANDTRTGGEKKLASYKDEWGEFLHKPAEDLKEKAEAEKFREKLNVRKEKRALEERLQRIRTLAESDDEVDDVSKWVQRNKRVVDQRKEAEQREQALEEMDAAFGVNHLIEKEKADVRSKAYKDKDLRGLRVDHDVDEFTEGKTIILTLKDKDVLDETDGDTLVNVNMIDEERYRKNVENKKLNPQSYGYNVYEEQYDEFGNPIERNILSKYDEEIDGKNKRKNFVLGESVVEEIAQRRKLLEIRSKLAGKRLETLADLNMQLASDTLTDAEMTKFKKPKKKVKKLRGKLKADDLIPIDENPTEKNFGSRRGGMRHHRNDDDDDEDNRMDTTENGSAAMKVEGEEDEQDLQRVLAKARKLKLKENIIKKSLPLELDMIKEEIKSEPTETLDNDLIRSTEGNIVLNATAEFCRTLGDIPTYGMAGNRNEVSNEMMDYEDLNVNDDNVSTHNDEPELNYGTWNSVNPDEVNQPADLEQLIEDVEERAILDEEPDVGAGVANALRLALSKGYLEKEEHNRPSNSKLAHLQAKNYSIDDKATADDDKFGGRRERYHAGPIMDFKDKETFKPNVKLEYIDDNGRVLNLKEAFRYLSHKFHGKGPGKNKIEKRLKKMEQEGLMKTMSSTDTPLGTLTMLQQKQKETKTAFVVLSGGNKTQIGSTVMSKYK